MSEIAISQKSIKTNGLRFEVTMAGTGDKLALLLHGFPESAYSWRYQIPLLARLGYRVWAPDLRGYGKSDKPKGISEYHDRQARAGRRRSDRRVGREVGYCSAATTGERSLRGISRCTGYGRSSDS